MKLTWKLNLEILGCVLLVVAASSFFVWHGNNSSRPIQLSNPIIAEAEMQNDTENLVSQVDTASQIAPDGTKKLVMNTSHNKDGSLYYVFTTTDGSGKNEQPLYATTSATESFQLPFNAWSPDDKYLFIEKNNGDALVFNASGEEIIEGQKYLDVENLFTAAGKKDIYKVTTGWASPTLLIVNTSTPENKKGSSYWFEVPSKAIMQLSSGF